MASAQQLAEATRLREAAQAALGEAEARWRSQLGAATQERQRLRAEISTLTKRLLGGGDAKENVAKRQRVEADPAEAALGRTEVYARYHHAEAALRDERERASAAEEQLQRLLGRLQTQLPVYREQSERLRGALESNASLSQRLAELTATKGADAEGPLRSELAAAAEAREKAAREAAESGARREAAERQRDRWRVLYEASISGDVPGGADAAAAAEVRAPSAAAPPPRPPPRRRRARRRRRWAAPSWRRCARS